MSTEIRWRQRFSNFQKAFGELGEAVAMEKYNKLEMQGVIQCFEYNIELAWKTLQDILHAKGYPEISGPRPVIKKAFAESYIVDDEGWLNMWDDRLKIAHTYDEAAALQIVENIKNIYYQLFFELHQRLLQEPEVF